MSKQGDLFDYPAPEPVIEPNITVPPEARRRVSRQALEILARLREGQVDVTELRGIACQYNARIYELRQAGYRVVNIYHNKESGASWYELQGEPHQ
jgi:hypothetical protein